MVKHDWEGMECDRQQTSRFARDPLPFLRDLHLGCSCGPAGPINQSMVSTTTVCTDAESFGLQTLEKKATHGKTKHLVPEAHFLHPLGCRDISCRCIALLFLSVASFSTYPGKPVRFFPSPTCLYWSDVRSGARGLEVWGPCIVRSCHRHLGISWVMWSCRDDWGDRLWPFSTCCHCLPFHPFHAFLVEKVFNMLPCHAAAVSSDRWLLRKIKSTRPVWSISWLQSQMSWLFQPILIIIANTFDDGYIANTTMNGNIVQSNDEGYHCNQWWWVYIGNMKQRALWCIYQHW